MKGQRKKLPDETSAGMGWILANIVSKEQFVMQRQQEFAKQHQHQKQYQPQQQYYGGRGSNTQQQQPQLRGNMSHHHQGWL